MYSFYSGSMLPVSFIIISSSTFTLSTLFFSSLIQINSLCFSNEMCINSLHSSDTMRILSFFSSRILLFCYLISPNWEESLETTSSQSFLFFNFSFSTFLPMGLSKVSPKFILSLSSSKFIEPKNVGQDGAAGYLACTFTLALRFNHLASFLKIF